MSMTTRQHFRPLPPEPWGRRLVRAREDVANLTLAEAARLAGTYMLTSDGTISRLERQPVVPSGPRQASRRQLAYVLCLCYEVDPADFDLGPDDLPGGIVIPPRTRDRDGHTLSTIWYCIEPEAA